MEKLKEQEKMKLEQDKAIDQRLIDQTLQISESRAKFGQEQLDQGTFNFLFIS